jgi:membrane-bound serine protease (ClpP class)
VRLFRLTVGVLVAFCGLVGAAAGAGAQAGVVSGRVDVVQVNGLIDPANAALVSSTLEGAQRDRASLIVYQIDGSGAVDTDIAPIARALRESKVPVAAWIGPSGGGAKAAALCLALAAGYVGVAPGAHLGKVDPVYYDDTSKKVQCDDPARPATIVKGVGTLQDFVASLDGKTLNGVKVTTLKGPPGKRTLTLDVHFHKLDLGQQLAHTLDTPWVAYFLFVVGLLLIVFEFFTAGVGIAGFVGACALIGGSFGFSHLPVSFWAVGLLMLGVLGLSIDVQAGGLGAWTFIGAAALTAGSIWLYDGSSQLDPSWWVLVLVIGGSVLFMLSGMTAMVRARFSTPTIGREELVGEMGEATADVDPDGVVRVRDALWRARTNRATPIKAGDPVRVVSVEGIVLEVEPETGGARDYRHRS